MWLGPIDLPAAAPLEDLWGQVDEGTRNHLVRAGRLARDLAGHVGLSPEEQADSANAGLLHDIGKAGLPPKLITKAAPLTLLERRLLRAHPEMGARWLGGVLGPEVLDAIRP